MRDDGIGIHPTALERIFGVFEQGGPTDTGGIYSGLGLGLAVVRELVHLHGGSIHAMSDGPGRGSEFLVRLPAPAGG